MKGFIYKITSPTNKVYIGQTTDYIRRFNGYKNLKSCINQVRLHASLLKYGVENHIFEVIEECFIKDLNIKERYWQDFYNVLNKNGLNCFLTQTDEKSKKLSEEVKIKIGLKNKGRIKSLSEREAISKRKKGSITSEETKIKQSQAKKGKKVTSETRLKISNSKKDKNAKGKALESLLNNKKDTSKRVMNTETKEIYDSIKQAYENNRFLFSYVTFRRKIKSNKINYRLI